MKIYRKLFFITLFICISIQWAGAQSTCGAIPAELPTAPTIIVQNIQPLAFASLSTNSNLPDIEYAIQFIGMSATDGLGDQIIAFTGDVINLNDFNFANDDQFRVTPIAYDLGQVQSIIDQLYNGSFFGLACCTVAGLAVPDVCPTLMQAGINQGSDIQNLSDIITLINIFNGQLGATLSVPSFINQINSLNDNASSLPNPCGGNQLPVCYAVPSLEMGSQVYRVVEFLPIRLISFEAYAEQNYNLLKWATATEENNAYFSIQRSTDGQDFAEIGRVAGSGTTTVTTSYKFVDNQPLSPFSYYRLQQVDFDGKSSFSDIVVLRREVESFDIISFGPNPNQGEMEVIISDVQSRNIDYFVININGNVLIQNSLNTVRGLNSFKLDLTELPSGIYFISIANDEVNRHLKFLKR